MLSDDQHCVQVRDVENHKSVSPASSELPAHVPDMTSKTQSDVSSTKHLAWASLIKEHHRHLQTAVQSCVRGSGTAVNATKDSSCCFAASVPLPPSYQEELEAWRSNLTGDAAEQRLAAYAEAMHSLATLYWEPPVPSLKRSNTGVVASNDAHREPAAEGGITMKARMADFAAPCIGEKRQRCSDTSESVQEMSSTPTERGIAPAGNAPMPIDNPRHYCDRLSYCLQSIASYYLGEAETGRSPVGPENSALDVVDDQSPAAVQCSTPAPVCVRVGQRYFRKLPGVFARVVKPLRRLFFQRNGRMATEVEVGELIRICTPSPGDCCEVAPVERVVDCASCPSSSTKEASGSTMEAKAVRELINADVDARTIVEESTWRRGMQTAWATALRYTRDTLHQSPALLPAPLWVLDVGSCYGPLFGKVLNRASSLPPIPLRVTSMDLAPYPGAVGCNSGSDGVPAPRVWQADWLRIEFFADDLGAGEVERTNHTTVAVGTAEGGRIQYQLQSPLGNSTGCEESTGSHLSSGRDACPDDAAPKPLVATAVRLESYDVIFFCLLLSYIPTPRLRFLACIHAFLALREGGLLVLVSTRTQGPRRRNWMDEWAACLALIGFQRVQQSVQEKLVGMSFAKVSLSAEVHRGWATAEGRATWIESLMTSSLALNGLRITADDARGRAVF